MSSDLKEALRIENKLLKSNDRLTEEEVLFLKRDAEGGAPAAEFRYGLNFLLDKNDEKTAEEWWISSSITVMVLVYGEHPVTLLILEINITNGVFDRIVLKENRGHKCWFSTILLFSFDKLHLYGGVSIRKDMYERIKTMKVEEVKPSSFKTVQYEPTVKSAFLLCVALAKKMKNCSFLIT